MTTSALLRTPFTLGPMPDSRRMRTVDERLVRAPLRTIFALSRNVERWPALLPHYRWVRFRERARDGGGVVEMAAWRPFGAARWPTWWLSEMSVSDDVPRVRFRHVEGITKGMDVEWSFTQAGDATHVRIVHMWDGPRWPLVGPVAATAVIGPLFVHGIATRTLAGLAGVAERNPDPLRG
jgi:ribosome-associated toxin RatA of RatAB toxin-antitoxin module